MGPEEAMETFQAGMVTYESKLRSSTCRREGFREQLSSTLRQPTKYLKRDFLQRHVIIGQR